MQDKALIEIKIDAKIELHHHHHGDVAAHGEMLQLLRDIKSQGETIMSQQDDALAAIKKIDDATTKQAASIQAEADLLQKTSDNIDALIAKLGTTVPADVLAGLQAEADKAQAISDSLDKQAAFAAALAAKGVTDPVPLPVPPPTPVTP